MISVTTELDAVNTMLSVIGESPVNTIDDNGLVDAAMARQILTSVSRGVQSRGWHFNTDKGLVLTPSFPEKEIQLPASLLRIDTVHGDAHFDVTQRGNRLYDRRRHTFQFDKPITVDMVVLLTFEELPETARQYITIRAARMFQERIVGSEVLSMFNAKDEARALVSLREMEADTADFNMLTDDYGVARVLDR